MIVCEDICVEQGDFRLRHLDLRIGTGEYWCIMGPSGAGKTILLESIAGLHRPSSGRIFVRDRDVTALAPEQRRVGLVYQDYSLFPHLTGYQNIAFGLQVHKTDPEKIRSVVNPLLEQFHITHLRDRYPHSMSGGEQQRVALARALAIAPEILLLDEPFAALDAIGRQQCIRDLRALQGSRRLTVIHVTHAWDEAHALADQVAIVMAGRLVQHGPVREVFTRPVNAAVARFVGVENILRGKVVARSAGGVTLDVGGLSLRAAGDAPPDTGDVAVCIRGTAWRVRPSGGPRDFAENQCTGVLREHTVLGDLERIDVDCGIPLTAVLRSNDLRRQGIRVGDTIRLQADPADIHVVHDASPPMY
jgi:molybdate/tungstate transport system ATP-binding protein